MNLRWPFVGLFFETQFLALPRYPILLLCALIESAAAEEAWDRAFPTPHGTATKCLPAGSIGAYVITKIDLRSMTI